MSTAAEKYELMLEAGRARQRAYYEKNKGKISANRKADRIFLKDCREAKSAAPCSDCSVDVIPEPSEPEIPLVAKAKKTKRVAISEPVVAPEPEPEPELDPEEPLTLENVMKALDKIALIEVKGRVRSLATMSTHRSNVKRYFQITGCSELNTCLLDSKKILSMIDKALIPKTNEPYSTNTKKGYIHSLLLVLEHTNLLTKEQLKPYRQYASAVTAQSETEKIERLKSDESAVILFSEYLKRVLTEFGKNSKENVYMNMFSEAPCRDDYQLKIVESIDETKDESTNFLVLPKGRKALASVVLNHYKTSKNKDDPVVTLLTKQTSALVASYLKDQKLTYGGWVFGNKMHTKFVVATSLKIGIKNGGISYLRSSVVSERSPNMSPIERADLAQKMGHSSATALTYIHRVK